MELHQVALPVWKTRDYTFPLSKLGGKYVAYLKRSGSYFFRNTHGVKVKITPTPEELPGIEELYRLKTVLTMTLTKITMENE